MSRHQGDDRDGSGRVPYERLPVAEADLAELDDELLRQYLVNVRRLPELVEPAERAHLLVNLGLATRLPDRIVPTVAGLLLFGARRQDRLPAAAAVIVAIPSLWLARKHNPGGAGNMPDSSGKHD